VNDHEIEAIAEKVAQAGAIGMGYLLLRLPLEVEGLFRDWLDVHHPDRADRVMAAIRDARGGKAYDATWGKRMRGEGPIADLIARRFEVALRRYGLAGGRFDPLRTDLFQRPGPRQESLFD
jgi:DNA repair photolyase